MGRNSIIPHSYDDQAIKFRIPYTMPGELVVGASASGEFFPDGAFNFNIDKPFEIERMIVRLTALDSDKLVIEPQPTTLQKRVRLTITDTSKNEDLTKARTTVETLISSLDGGDGSWEWYVPYTIVRSEGFTIGVDSSALPAGVENVKVEISFQGYLIVIQPASETR